MQVVFVLINFAVRDENVCRGPFLTQLMLFENTGITRTCVFPVKSVALPKGFFFLSGVLLTSCIFVASHIRGGVLKMRTSCMFIFYVVFNVDFD